MRVIVVGGAQVHDQNGFFNIGKRNYMAVRKILWRNNVMIDYEDVGGNVNRTLKLAIKTGQAWIKTPSQGVMEI
jgi:chemotaxis protein CheD